MRKVHCFVHFTLSYRTPTNHSPMVDSAQASLAIAVEEGQIVVEVTLLVCAEVAAEQRRVRREDGRDRERAHTAQDEADACLPLVEVRSNELL